MPTAPTITSVTPSVSETDVVLGTQIIVVFSELMNHTTITDATFSLTGPGQTMEISPDQLILKNPNAVTGREYITGTFSFDDTINNGTQTQLTFVPSRPLRPNEEYTVLIIGSGGILTGTNAVMSAAEVPMASSYEWSFTTGELNLVVPPPQSPVAGCAPPLDPKCIVVIPRQSGNQITGANLTQEIDLIFPSPVSLSPYDPTGDILCSIEAILGDPQVRIPSGLTVTPSWSSYGGQANRRLTLLIQGWPPEPQFPWSRF
jgi:hypothetical protein